MPAHFHDEAIKGHDRQSHDGDHDLNEQSALRITRMIHGIERSTVVTKDSLFSQLAQSDGRITRTEFDRLFDGVQNAVHAEHEQEKELGREVTRAKRRGNFLCALAMVLVPLVAILLAGNFGLVWTVVEMTRETKADEIADGVSRLVDKDTGEPMETAMALSPGALLDLPEYGRTYDYAKLQLVTLYRDDAVFFEKVDRVKWSNDTHPRVELTTVEGESEGGRARAAAAC